MLVADSEIEGGERTKLLDFGIAKLLPALPRSGQLPPEHEVRTRKGVVLGTPMYMSPEQCRGARTLDGKSDVYSLGVLIYHLLAGQPPFVSHDGELAVMAMHMVDPVPSLASRVPEATPALAQLVERMLAKLPAERPTMSEVAAELTLLSDGGPPAEPSRTLLVAGADLVVSSPTNPTTLRGLSGQLAASLGGSRRSWLLAGGLSAFILVGVLLLLHADPSPRGAARPLTLQMDPTPSAPAAASAGPAAPAVTPPPAPPLPPSPPSLPAVTETPRHASSPAHHAPSKAAKPGKRRPSRLVD